MGTGVPFAIVTLTICRTVVRMLALTYLPGSSPTEYFQHCKAYLPCSEWERVYPLRLKHQLYGAPSGIRTRDPLIKSQLLYQLS